MNVSLAGKVYLRAQQIIKPLEDRKKMTGRYSNGVSPSWISLTYDVKALQTQAP